MTLLYQTDRTLIFHSEVEGTASPFLIKVLNTPNPTPVQLEATVVSDAVNTAARLEGLTKYYQANIIITEDVLVGIATPVNLNYRFLGKVLVKGKSEVVAIYEVFDNDKPNLKKLKQSANPAFQKGLDFYFEKDFIGAITQFKKALEIYPNAPIIQRYFQKLAELITQQLPMDWTGAEVMSEK